jgi:twitching motility protein PilT
MFVNQAIQNLIREDKVHQVANVIATSARDDMLTLDDSLADLVDQGQTSFEAAYPYFEDAEKRALVQKRHYRVMPIRQAGSAGRR